MSRTAPCIACGKMVFMLRVKDTSLAVAMDPFEPGTPYWTDSGEYGGGFAQLGGGYIRHTCDVDVVTQFRSTWLGKVNLQNELNTAAYAQVCPKCYASPGEECWNLLERAKGREIHTKAPHQDRYPEGLLT